MGLLPSIPFELRKRYIERRKEDLFRLEEALFRRDGEAFQQVGHQIKGNAATYSYLDLEAIGIELEKAGRALDFESASQALDTFRFWIVASDPGYQENEASALSSCSMS